jgi:hypothetical protein
MVSDEDGRAARAGDLDEGARHGPEVALVGERMDPREMVNEEELEVVCGDPRTERRGLLGLRNVEVPVEVGRGDENEVAVYRLGIGVFSGEDRAQASLEKPQVILEGNKPDADPGLPSQEPEPGATARRADGEVEERPGLSATVRAMKLGKHPAAE